MKITDLLKYNPNLLIKGLPGTGKKHMVRQLIESFEKIRNPKKDFSFADVEKQGRVKTVVFHPSHTYENFVEAGTFMDIVLAATLEQLKSEIKGTVAKKINNASKIWKVSLGYRRTEERIYKICEKNNEIAIGWLENDALDGKSYAEIYASLKEKRGDDEPKLSGDAGSLNIMLNEMKPGDFILVYDQDNQVIRIGIIDSDYYYLNDYQIPYPHRRKVKWLKKLNKTIDLKKYDPKARFSFDTFYELEQLNFVILKKLLKENTSSGMNIKPVLPYYLLINGIENADLIKVFGDLLLLIAQDKRDRFYVSLASAKTPFTLPSNLYIIATMDTLSRTEQANQKIIHKYFSIWENHCCPALLKNIQLTDSQGKNSPVKLDLLLEVLNKRITAELEPQDSFGHTMFINLKTIKELYYLWYYRLIPSMKHQLKDKSILKQIIGSSFFNHQDDILYLGWEVETSSISDFEQALLELK